MSLFERLGEKVETFKQEAEAARDDEAYRCEECEERFYSDREACPKCGSDDVSSVDQTSQQRRDQ